ncbi:GntR family transcriptional regulator, partial [Mesorhizobium metallidurans]|uniref:GntR family transcriptional regulator n=1 Tax=Mesorhizobium metallidurans TaxID=489722 RepID=UPI00058B559C
MRLKSSWTPRIGGGDGPVYQRIAAAIIEDLSHGNILPGARLPAQRDLAFDLHVGLGTVTKAYGLLTKRGVAAPEKGRAMFITSKPAESTVIEMDVNIPPNLLSGKMLRTVV